MQQQMRVIAAVAAIGLAGFAAHAHANDRATGATGPKGQTNPSASQAKVTTPPDAGTAPANSPVHRFFNAWGNGMQRGANAIGLDKDPLEGKLPQPKIKPLFGKSSEPEKDKR